MGELLAAALFFIANAAASKKERAELRDRALLVARIYAVMLVATQVLRPLLFAFSRSREWAADRFAIAATRDPAGGAAAFARLRDQNWPTRTHPRGMNFSLHHTRRYERASPPWRRRTKSILERAGFAAMLRDRFWPTHTFPSAALREVHQRGRSLRRKRRVCESTLR